MLHVPGRTVRTIAAVALVLNRAELRLDLRQFGFESARWSSNLCLIHQDASPVVLFNGENHVFVDVYVPTLSNSEPHCGFRLPDNHTAQRHAQFIRRHLQNDRLSYPERISTWHGVPPQVSRCHLHLEDQSWQQWKDFRDE